MCLCIMLFVEVRILVSIGNELFIKEHKILNLKVVNNITEIHQAVIFWLKFLNVYRTEKSNKTFYDLVHQNESKQYILIKIMYNRYIF